MGAEVLANEPPPLALIISAAPGGGPGFSGGALALVHVGADAPAVGGPWRLGNCSGTC